MEFNEVDPGNHWNFLLRLCQASVKSLFLHTDLLTRQRVLCLLSFPFPPLRELHLE